MTAFLATALATALAVLPTAHHTPAQVAPTAPPLTVTATDPVESSDLGLDGWKLTLPTSGGSGHAASVSPAASSPPWLTRTSDGLTFWAPTTGATTPNSQHPRTELVRLASFQAGTGRHTLAATATVTQVPTSSRDVILGQIHGADSINSVPFVMLHFVDGRIQVAVRQARSGPTASTHTLLQGIRLGTPFTFTISDNGDGTIGFTCRDGQRVGRAATRIPRAFLGAPVRFQVGDYQQGKNSGVSIKPDRSNASRDSVNAPDDFRDNHPHTGTGTGAGGGDDWGRLGTDGGGDTGGSWSLPKTSPVLGGPTSSRGTPGWSDRAGTGRDGWGSQDGQDGWGGDNANGWGSGGGVDDPSPNRPDSDGWSSNDAGGDSGDDSGGDGWNSHSGDGWGAQAGDDSHSDDCTCRGDRHRAKGTGFPNISVDVGGQLGVGTQLTHSVGHSAGHDNDDALGAPGKESSSSGGDSADGARVTFHQLQALDGGNQPGGN